MKSGIMIDLETMEARIAAVERQRDEACAAAQGFQLAFEEADRLIADLRAHPQMTANIKAKR